jgi:hypothetical protein
VPSIWHSTKKPLCRVPVLGSRQRLTAVSFRTAADGRLPSAFFAECQILGKHVFAECGPVPSVLRSVKRLVTESRTLPSAALGKAFFVECPTKGTRQRIRHSTKPRIPVVVVASSSPVLRQVMLLLLWQGPIPIPPMCHLSRTYLGLGDEATALPFASVRCVISQFAGGILVCNQSA